MTTAILGGVFDPPHLGHRALAEGALEQLRPTQLLVLVNDAPGHKEAVLDGRTRLELAKIAFRGLPRTRVELDETYPFTVDLLRDEDFVPSDILVLGADEWAAFDSWKEPDEIRRSIRIAVAARPGAPLPEGDVDVFEIAAVPVSSREIRARIAAGQPIDGLVHPVVAREIQRRGLYGGRRG